MPLLPEIARLTVDGDRPRRAAMVRIESPAASQCNVLALGERQIAALPIPPSTWTHPTGLTDPRQPAVAMGSS